MDHIDTYLATTIQDQSILAALQGTLALGYGGPFAQKIFVSLNMRGDVRYVTVTKL